MQPNHSEAQMFHLDSGNVISLLDTILVYWYDRNGEGARYERSLRGECRASDTSRDA